MNRVQLWLVDQIVKLILSQLTPELLRSLKKKLVDSARKLAAEQTPDFALDDAAVEVLARFLEVE